MTTQPAAGFKARMRYGRETENGNQPFASDPVASPSQSAITRSTCRLSQNQLDHLCIVGWTLISVLNFRIGGFCWDLLMA